VHRIDDGHRRPHGRENAMARNDEDWRNPGTRALVDAVLTLRDADEMERFLRDLCTLGELHDLAQRWWVARLLDSGMHYAEISRVTGASTATITRIASWVRHGQGGYAVALERTRPAGAPSPAGAASLGEAARPARAPR
jgi:TrpR-related protein YerC/YecD